MAEIKGTNITAPIAPFTTDDIYPTHYAEYGKGGYRTLETKSDLDNIPEARLEIGMLVYVKEDSKIYQLQSDNTWKELSTGGTDLKYYSEDGNYQGIFPYYAGEVVESENTITSISIAKENEGFGITDNSISMMSVDGELNGSIYYQDKNEIDMRTDLVNVQGQEFRTNVVNLNLNANQAVINSGEFNINGKAYYNGNELAAYEAGENITIEEDGKISALKDIVKIYEKPGATEADGSAKGFVFEGNSIKYPNTVNYGTGSALGSSILGVANTLGNGTGNIQNCFISGAYNIHNQGNASVLFGMRNETLLGSNNFNIGTYNRIGDTGNNGAAVIGGSNYANYLNGTFMAGAGNTLKNNYNIPNETIIGQYLVEHSTTGSNNTNFLLGAFQESRNSSGVVMIGTKRFNSTYTPYLRLTGDSTSVTYTINSKDLKGVYDNIQELVGLTPLMPNSLASHRTSQKAHIVSITDTSVTFSEPIVPSGTKLSNTIVYFVQSILDTNCDDSLVIGNYNYLKNSSTSKVFGTGHRITNKNNVFAIGNYSDSTKDGNFFIGDGTSSTDRHNFIYGLKNDFTIDSSKLTLEVDELNVKGVNGNVVDKLNKIEELELFKYPNVTIYGNPTIKQGQASDFSAENYFRFPYLINFDGKPFQIGFAFTTGEYETAQQNIIDSNKGLAIAIRGRQLVYNVSFNGTSWVYETICSATIQPNTTYYAHFTYDGTSYHMDLTEDPGEGFTRVGSFRAPNTSLFPTPIYIGKAVDSSNYFKGIINLNEAYLNVAGTQIWTGMDDSGMASRLSVDLTNISDAGEAKIKEIAGGGGGTALNYYSEDTATETANINANGGFIVNGKKMPTFEYDDSSETLNITF